MSKNTQIGELINYISVNESGDVVLSNGHLVATQNYVSTAVANLVDAAPATLDTLNELAAALGDDPNFATTVTNSIGGKLSLTGGTLTGALNGTSASFTGAVTSDDLILTAGTLFGAGNTGFSNRLSDTTLYLQMPATGFNITDNALNTRFILSSTGEATFSRVPMTNQASYNYQNIRVTSGFGGGYVDAKIQSLLAAYDGNIYGADIGYSYDGGGVGNTGYSLRFSTNDDLTGNPIERLRINSTGAATFSSSVTASNLGFIATNAYGITSYSGSTASGDNIIFGAGVYNTFDGVYQSSGSTRDFGIWLNGGTISEPKFVIKNSGNVGIGTTGPGAKLQVGVYSTVARPTGEPVAAFSSSTGTETLVSYGQGTTNGNTGVTLSFNPNRGGIGGNSGWYQRVDGATANGFMSFGQIVRGTPSTLTEHIRIASGGNVGIGTDSPFAKLEVVGGNNLPPSTGTQNYTIAVRDPTSMVANVGGSILFQGFKTSTSAIGNFAYIAGKKENGTAGNEAGYLAIGTFDSSGIPAEQMRITSAGNMILQPGRGIALNTPDGSDTGYLAISGAGGDGGNRGGHIYLSGNERVVDAGNVVIAAGNISSGTGAPGAIVFRTGDGNERMRITPGGYLKATSSTYTNLAGGFHEINQNSNGSATIINTHSGTSDPYGIEVNFTGHDPNNASNYMFGAYKTSGGFTWIYRIFSNGTVSARSDARWKKNIETTRNGYIDDLCKLRVVKYNWYNHEDDTPKELGLIAQEVEEVFPNLVQHDPVISKREVEQEDGSFVEEEFEDGTSRSIKVSVLPYMLLKAIQELKAENDLLKARLDNNNIN